MKRIFKQQGTQKIIVIYNELIKEVVSVEFWKADKRLFNISRKALDTINEMVNNIEED